MYRRLRRLPPRRRPCTRRRSMRATVAKTSALYSTWSRDVSSCTGESNMVGVIQTSGPGGAEVLQLVAVELDAPKAGEVLLRQTAVGVNLIDVYHRSATQG